MPIRHPEKVNKPVNPIKKKPYWIKSKLLNSKEFWSLDYFTNKYVLDPRPETEAIIEESLNIIKNKKAYLRILDIGTGSGAIAISLAREFVNAKIIAIYISDQAIQVAKKNISENFLTNIDEHQRCSRMLQIIRGFLMEN